MIEDLNDANPERELNVIPFKPSQFKDYCDTPTVMKIIGLLDATRAAPSITIIMGEPGIGKSVASRAYADGDPHRIFRIEVTGSCCSRKDIIGALLDALGIYGSLRSEPRSPGAERNNFAAICEQLVSRKRPMIILDEAQKLEDQAIELIRELYDAAPVSFALVANPKFTARIFGQMDEAGSSEFPQLAGRVGISRNIHPKPDDIEKLCEFYQIESTEARKIVRKWATRDGRLHQVKNLLALARAFASEGQPLNLGHLQQAYKLLSN